MATALLSDAEPKVSERSANMCVCMMGKHAGELRDYTQIGSCILKFQACALLMPVTWHVANLPLNLI